MYFLLTNDQAYRESLITPIYPNAESVHYVRVYKIRKIANRGPVRLQLELKEKKGCYADCFQSDTQVKDIRIYWLFYFCLGVVEDHVS
jgi:hypothetical protein